MSALSSLLNFAWERISLFFLVDMNSRRWGVILVFAATTGPVGELICEWITWPNYDKSMSWMYGYPGTKRKH